jgi:hypothetical protein
MVCRITNLSHSQPFVMSDRFPKPTVQIQLSQLNVTENCNSATSLPPSTLERNYLINYRSQKDSQATNLRVITFTHCNRSSQFITSL